MMLLLPPLRLPSPLICEGGGDDDGSTAARGWVGSPWEEQEVSPWREAVVGRSGELTHTLSPAGVVAGRVRLW